MAWDVSDDPVDFDEAIAWFGNRVKMTRQERDALEAKARRQAFFVSGVSQLDIITDAWQAIDDALSNGTTFEDFKREIGAKLEAAWRGSVDDPAWRLETIFRTNVQGAYGAGRYEQATHEDLLEDRPVWMFDAILDGRETEICRACDGTKLPADDPWWKTHLAPLHYNCRSGFITLTEKEAGRITLVKPTVKAQNGFGAAPDDGEAIEQWAAQKVANAPAPVQAAQRQKTHDPAHWQPFYGHYGDAAETVSYGRAAMEKGLDTPIDDVSKSIAKLSAKGQVPLISEVVVAQAKLAGRKTLREVVDDAASSTRDKGDAQIAAMLAAHAEQVTAPKKLNVSPKYPSRKADRQRAKDMLARATAFIGGLVDAGLTHTVSIKWVTGRGYYDLKGTIVTGYRPHTIPHEWGHALEDLNPKLLERAIAFLEARTKNEQEQSLAALTGFAYGPREKAKPDAFANPYTGKTYKTSAGKRFATEVTSMGLEALFTGEAEVARIDLEHLLFTLGQLANR